MGFVVGGLIVLGIGVLVFLRSGGLITVVNVPDGEDWKTFYRRRRAAKAARRWGGWQWWLIGAGLGLTAVAGLLAWSPW
ncbi:MAG: hypothetical protein D6706_02095 [Chloroflexi bacterium]|nr:MAG: hypothetical protein D6706_02095 [Chloroflexota bacterium]